MEANPSTLGLPESVPSDPINRELQATLISDVRSLWADKIAPQRLAQRIINLEAEAQQVQAEAERKLTAIDEQLQAARYRAENIDTLYREAQENLETFNGRFKISENRSKIDKLKEIQRQIAELEAQAKTLE